MKKSIILVICLMAVASAVATQTNRPERVNELLQARVSNVTELVNTTGNIRSVEDLKNRTSRKEQFLLNAQSAERPNRFSNPITLENHRPTASRQAQPFSWEGKHQLDSIILRNNAGNYLLRELYSYDENLRPVRRRNYMFENDNWNFHSQVEKTWNEDGFMLTHLNFTPGDNFGRRRIYTYDSQNRVTSVTRYSYYPAVGLFVELQKNLFEYDVAGNVIKELQMHFVDDDWVNFVKFLNEYDEVGLATYIKLYNWRDERWVGHSFHTIERTPEFICAIFYVWADAIRAWVPEQRIRNYFLDNHYFSRRRVTLQKICYWNPENEDWYGNVYRFGETNFNRINIFSHDAQNRTIHSLLSVLVGDNWIPAVEVEHTWNDPIFGFGEVEEIQRWYFYDEAGITRTLEGLLTRTHSLHFEIESGHHSHEKYSAIIDGNWVYIQESERFWNYDGFLVEELHWFFAENNKRFANERITYQRQWATNLIEETVFYFGQGTSDNDWIRFMTARFEIENGVQTGNRIYLGEELELIAGLRIAFDFTVPHFDLIVFDVPYPYPLKVLRRYEYHERGGVLVPYVRTFYWSPAGQTSIQNPNADNAVFVFPNPVANSFTIGGIEESTLVSITDIHGRVVLQQTVSLNENISVNHLPAGIYFVRVNGNVVRIVRR